MVFNIVAWLFFAAIMAIYGTKLSGITFILGTILIIFMVWYEGKIK